MCPRYPPFANWESDRINGMSRINPINSEIFRRSKKLRDCLARIPNLSVETWPLRRLAAWQGKCKLSVRSFDLVRYLNPTHTVWMVCMCMVHIRGHRRCPLLGILTRSYVFSILEWLIMICKANCHYIYIHWCQDTFILLSTSYKVALGSNWKLSDITRLINDGKVWPQPHLSTRVSQSRAHWHSDPQATWLTSQGSAGRKSLRGPIGRRSARVSSRSCSGSAN